MRISNAFHTYELVFIFLIHYLKISAAWGKGKYFSDYEYPEIQLLFSAKEEANGEGGRKVGNGKTALDAVPPPVLDMDVIPNPKPSSLQKLTNEQRSKPWMRGPYAEAIIKEKNNEEEKLKKAKELKLSGQRKKNKQFTEVSSKEDAEPQFWQRVAKPRKIISNYMNPLKESDYDLDNGVQQRKTKHRKRIKNQNHNRVSSLKDDVNKRFKNKVVKNWHEYDGDSPRYEGSDTLSDIEPKAKKTALINVNEKLYSDSRIFPRNEENVQEYEELTDVQKNNAMAVDNQQSTNSAVNQTKEEMMNSAKNTYEKSGLLNKNVDITNLRSTVPNESFNLDSTIKAIIKGNPGADMTTVDKAKSLVTENSRVSGVPPSTATLSTSTTVQEINSKPNVLVPSAIQLKEGINKENGMFDRQSNRAAQDNHPLLAKPPVKIAGTLMDKHSEDDNEVNVEEKGAKMVKVAQINTFIQSSTSLASSGLTAGLQNNVENNAHEQATAKAVLLTENNDPSKKKKRNINENKSVKIMDLVVDKSHLVAPSQKMLDNKTTEKKSRSESIDPSVDLRDNEIYESRKSKPQYYSLTKRNSALSMVNNLMSRFKPAASRKKKMREDKINESFKRNAPSTYDLVYDSGYDYNKNKGSKKGVPIRNYYDYENDYDLDYEKDKDYNKMRHFNNSALAAEKEYEYDGKNFNYFRRGKNKSKRNKYRKVEENYQDIFAHPISLDDPELQILRDEDDELVKRRIQHKNFVTRHHKEKPADREFSQYQSMDLESFPHSHLKKKTVGQALYPRNDNVQVANKPEINENEVSDKKIH